MTKHRIWIPIALFGGGAAFALRLAMRMGVLPWSWGLPVFLAILAAAAAVCSLKMPRGISTLPAAFAWSRPAAWLTGAGALMILASGIWELLPAALEGASLPLALGGGSVLAGLGLLTASSAIRRPDGRIRGRPLLLPAVALAVRVLEFYLVWSTEPVLERFYPELLALCAFTLAFFHLAEFAFHSGSPRKFLWPAVMGTALGCMAQAGPLESLQRLLWGGCTLALLGVLCQLRLNPQTAAEEYS